MREWPRPDIIGKENKTEKKDNNAILPHNRPIITNIPPPSKQIQDKQPAIIKHPAINPDKAQLPFNPHPAHVLTLPNGH